MAHETALFLEALFTQAILQTLLLAFSFAALRRQPLLLAFTLFPFLDKALQPQCFQTVGFSPFVQAAFFLTLGFASCVLACAFQSLGLSSLVQPLLLQAFGLTPLLQPLGLSTFLETPLLHLLCRATFLQAAFGLTIGLLPFLLNTERVRIPGIRNSNS